MKQFAILPRPKRLTYKEGKCKLDKVKNILINTDDLDGITNTVNRFIHIFEDAMDTKLSICNKKGDIKFNKVKNLKNEEYEIIVSTDEININFSHNAGAFMAVSSFKQIISQCNKTIPCLYLHDFPDISARGIMLDISRCKVPNMETIKQIISMMADVKYNQLQLYIDDFVFAYPDFPNLWEDRDPITLDQLEEIQTLCEKSFIELVPNQNSFGHMENWFSARKHTPVH